MNDAKALDDTRALDLIAQILGDDEDWNADTLQDIAGIVTGTGREITSTEC